ncbi:uncharacterized protein LOC125206433 [Salvia hispanica]|uniref:uncharacterized protein LOC125206433 n=1 Tax=Salvia hispanica TaxID=49212 RepID=UPI0020095E61|nr:uncharacterized protein LOC125206433 [Salvia hispanica]
MDSGDENFQRLVDEEFEELVAAVQDEADEEEVALAAAAAIPRPRYRRRFINRDHVGADQRLMEDYFGDNPRYTPEIFHRRFRMSQRLFIHIADCLSQRYRCFTLRSDATGRPGLSTYQKCTAAIRQLAYAGPADMFDEYLQMARNDCPQDAEAVLQGYQRTLQRGVPTETDGRGMPETDKYARDSASFPRA